MKPIKRAVCPLCKTRVDTTDIKVGKDGNCLKLQCPKDGTPMRLSEQWYVRATINGKTDYVPCGHLKRDAEDYIATFRVAKRSGSILPGQEKDISWEDAKTNCESWWDAALVAKDKNKISQATRDHYKFQVMTLDKYFFGMSLLTITKASVNNMVEHLGKTHSPASVAHVIKTLKRMYSMHIKNLDLEENPRPKLIEKSFIIGKVDLPVVDNRIEVSCNADAIKAVVGNIKLARGKKLDKQRLELAILIGLGTGMRSKNICGLEWAELDLPNAILKISKTKMKGKRDFQCVLPDKVVDALKAWRLEVGMKSLFVFPSPKDSTKPMGTMRRAMSRHIEVCKLNEGSTSRQNKITPYIMTRHTSATEMKVETGDCEIVAHLLGHADSRITKARYIKDSIEDDRVKILPHQNAMLERMVGS